MLSRKPAPIPFKSHRIAPLENALTGDSLDPVADIPEYKHSAVQVRKQYPV